MKIKNFLIAVLILSIGGNIQAQSLFDRAKNAANKAIEKKMENANSNKTNTNKNTSESNNSQTDGSYVIDENEDYAAKLIPEEEETTFNYSLLKYSDNGNFSTISFKTYEEAIAAMPALPNAKDLISESFLDSYRAQLTDYQKAFENLRLAYMDAIARMSAMGAKASRSATAHTQAQMAQRQAMSTAFSQLSKEELAKMEKMSNDEAMAYMKKNHPEVLAALTQGATAGNTTSNSLNINEKKADAYDSILTQLMDIQDQANASMYTDMYNNELQGDFAKLRMEIINSWKNSAEYAKINQMEKELIGKVKEFDKNNKSQEYPPFWSAERKKQNEIVDQWNTKQAEKWLKKIADWQLKYKAMAEDIATLDARLEQVRNGDEEDFLYLKTKMTSAMLSNMVSRYVNLSGGVFCFPQILHVQEQLAQ